MYEEERIKKLVEDCFGPAQENYNGVYKTLFWIFFVWFLVDIHSLLSRL